MKINIKSLWVISQFIILIYIIIDLLILYNEEALMKLVALELLLTPPAWFIVIFINYIFIGLIKVSISETNILYIIFNWILFYLFGYIQWFILLPKIYKKIWGVKEMHHIFVNKYLLTFGIIFIGLYALLFFI